MNCNLLRAVALNLPPNFFFKSTKVGFIRRWWLGGRAVDNVHTSRCSTSADRIPLLRVHSSSRVERLVAIPIAGRQAAYAVYDARHPNGAGPPAGDPVPRSRRERKKKREM